MRQWARGIVPALVVSVLVACGDESSARPATPSPAAPTPVAIAAGEPIAIGISAALTGDQAAIGADIADAAQLAARDFGLVRGRPVEIVRVDDGCGDSEMAAAAARELVAHSRLVAVVGPMCTTGVQAAGALYDEASTAHITPSASRDELSQQGERFFFRTAWRDGAQASVQARYAREAGAATALVVNDGQPYGKTLADAFETAFESLGGDIIGRERIEPGTTDFAGLARQIQSAAPGAVVFEGVNPEGALFIRALRVAGYTGTFIGPDALANAAAFIQPPDPGAEGAVLTGAPMPDPAFVTRFRDSFQRLPSTPFILQSHDAATAILKAIDASATTVEDDALTIDRRRLADAVRQQAFDGYTGRVAFDEHGDRAGESAPELGLRIYRVQGAEFVVVE